MFVGILGLVVFYFAIAILVARLCSINSRWERLADRIPGPHVASSKVGSVLLPDEDEPLEGGERVAPPAS